MAKESAAPPIDRPLSKTYLREFTGWSTAYSPSLSESTSLRQLDNVMMGRDGSARIRPALRNMFSSHLPPTSQLVGSFEQYINPLGGKSILYALREAGDVTFYTRPYVGGTYTTQTAVATSPVWGDSSYVKYLQINNRIYCLSNNGDETVAIFDTNTETFLPITGYGSTRPPTATLALAGALTTGTYNYAFFYTVVNEFGESKPSELAHITANTKWTGWSSGDTISLSGLPASTPINVYWLSWSEDAPVPVEGVLLKEAHVGATLSVTAMSLLQSSSAGNHFLPSPADEDFTTPPVCAQGLVSADRLILVNDFENRARIRWSSNEPGSYGSFSPGKGGGYKTLSSGNLQIPYAVQLWQNPQSVDTLTVLCSGLDGYHAAYYMSPASITSQTEETIIMGFEETTATPGTVSPYGCEVFNNALYHPLDDQLMKSTANNYNISHKTMSDAIANKWLHLENKRDIVSSQYDGRLYFLVNNPDGEPLEDGCIGNEIWVCDVGTGEASPWSRFTIGACSLRKIESNGKLYMGVVRPEAIYRLDDLAWLDQLPGGDKAISWFLQTNPIAANSARDAWCHLQYVQPTLGSMYGTVRYGIRSWTVDGKPLDIDKVYRQPNPIDFTDRPLPFDHEDMMQVRRDVQEWLFQASSVVDPVSKETLPCYGQINNVLFSFAPVSVNVGYEYGSTQTYEYSHAGDHWSQRTAINGIPIPFIDPRRP